jgi:RHS repeat-associated protein
LGRRETATLPNTVSATYTYDDAGRLSNLTHEGVSSFDYTEHDNVGNRLSMTTAGETHTYTYDDIYEVTVAAHPQSPTETLTYDGFGNRLTSADYPTWTYDDNNRLTGYNGTAYTHDENGNTVTKTDPTGTTTYTYDSENKLVRIDFPGGGFVEYVYDGLGRRIEKNANGTITRYVYDLEDILFDYDGNNELTARYTHGPGIDDPIAMDRGGESNFYHSDGLGSITQITDSSKQILASYGYDAFGNITSQTGSLTNSYTFTGREYDPESGLYYYRARYYDPTTGRFLSADPVPGYLIIPLSLNLYPYTWNNPINYRDPDGRLVGVIIGIAIGGTSGVSGAIVQGGDIVDILVSGILGATGGAAVGFIDPTGIAATMILAGGIGAGGNLLGQIFTHLMHDTNRDCMNINIGSIIGSGIGSAIGGGMGHVMTTMAFNLGAPPVVAYSVSTIGIVPSALGGGFGKELNP